MFCYLKINGKTRSKIDWEIENGKYSENITVIMIAVRSLTNLVKGNLTVQRCWRHKPIISKFRGQV